MAAKEEGPGRVARALFHQLDLTLWESAGPECPISHRKSLAGGSERGKKIVRLSVGAATFLPDPADARATAIPPIQGAKRQSVISASWQAAETSPDDLQRSLNNEKYNLSFTAASLRPELSRILAEKYLDSESWEEAKQRVRSDNSLQARSPRSSSRMERELRQRLQTLTRNQLLLLAHSTTEDQAAMAWLAMIKYNALALEFSAEVLRDKLESFDPVLRPSDYEQFIESKVVTHPELDRLATTTRAKIRNVLLRTLVEAGLLTAGQFLGRIQRPQLSPDAMRAVRDDDPRLLAGFLFTDSEIFR